MSKKSRKKSNRIISASRSTGNSAPVAGQSAKPAARSAPATAKSYMSPEELAGRYKYVSDDLKLIALIAVPLILVLIIASFFVTI